MEYTLATLARDVLFAVKKPLTYQEIWNQGTTSDIMKDDDLLTELYRLSSLFGVGIIKLMVNDIDSSSVLYQAKLKDRLDWLTINKLSEVSCCFREFIAEITSNYKSQNVDASRYDDIIDDPQKYIDNLLNA